MRRWKVFHIIGWTLVRILPKIKAKNVFSNQKNLERWKSKQTLKEKPFKPKNQNVIKIECKFWSPQALFASEVLLLDFPGAFGSIQTTAIND